MDGDGDDAVVVLSSLNLFLFDNVTEDSLERSDGHKVFVRGDVNSDGRVDTTDIQQIARIVLPGDSTPACEKTLEADENGKVEIFDAMRVASSLFGGLGPLPAPLAPLWRGSSGGHSLLAHLFGVALACGVRARR